MKKIDSVIWLRLAALVATAALAALCCGIWQWEQVPVLPKAGERKLLRVWVTSSVGGGNAWLKEQLREWEKQNAGVMTYLRAVSPEEVMAEDAVLADVLLYMPGDFTAPQDIFAPLTGNLTVREALLRAGRWQGTQYGLPLCWGAWVLAIDGELEPELASTPAPTTLLGHPVATVQPQVTEEPGYPLEAANQKDIPLQAPAGASLFALSLLVDEKPRLPENFAQMIPADVYSGFRGRQYAAAMLTTGQITAFSSLTSAGKGFPFRVITPREVITDQVWLGSVVQNGVEEAASLLAFLTGKKAQQALCSQGLHTVRDDLRLYVTGTEAEIEMSAVRGMTAINAYFPTKAAESAAWRVWERQMELNEALLGLI